MHGVAEYSINIGYTMKRDLDACGNLYKHPHMKHKCVWFPRDLNPIGPEGFMV